jgi:AcrR family transcriptional regulator
MIQTKMATPLKTSSAKPQASSSQALDLQDQGLHASSLKDRSPRERILETASSLFYINGFRAIGIDRIIAESGVAKMTFYKHFPSKDDLIRVYLENASEHHWTWVNSMIAEHSTPRAQLEAIFEGVAKLTGSPQCLGCAWTNAAAEFPDMTHPGHLAALDFKNKMLAKLEELSRAAKARDPEGLAQDLMLVMDGAWAASRVFGMRNHGARAGVTAKNLIAAQLK